ncbi:stage II sporulation protein R [Ammoniphilus sp. CFH 90114]|uniref:stage II sporulation protein R n=1 Tax=Ammoniphilus sp. CFH 90114 TaxID=2493665 RepID=UPI00100FB99B|nr:stage II sporulation protein R [Ammoniphilus sp. CFH 90114]RXT08691.1 stage II sporulation protein R [Ammoniphilus sp. CFH 90114]
MKKTSLILFAFIILTMSWEEQRSIATLVKEEPIPQESIRLRVIANSDSPQDQWLKQEIRDEINLYLTSKVDSLDTVEEAREKMEEELPQLQEIVEKTITNNGFSYNSQVELGKVPFPTKMYGQYVYPAGEYEALRVTVGQGMGQNWWCVLFPPLCFVDIDTGDAVKKEEENGEDGEGPKIQVKFFVLEVFQKLYKSLFS